MNNLPITNKHISLSSINPFIVNISGSRGMMSSTALSGITQICHPQERIIISTDTELGKGVMNVMVDVDSKVYTYFMKRDIYNNISHLQLVLVDVHTNEHYLMDVPKYSDNNYTYGFAYIWDDIIKRIVTGVIDYLPKGTILARSPGSKENGGYAIGLTFNTLYVSHPSGAEDTYVISESAAKRAKLKVYSRITVSCGLNSVLINAYGDKTMYKPFPSEGEFIREDRLLCAVREFDETNILNRGSNKSLMDESQTFDKCVYVPHPNGKVVHIEIVEAPRNKKKSVLDLDGVLKEYVVKESNYYDHVLKYNDMVGRDNAVEMDNELINLIVRAKFNNTARHNVGKVIKTMKKDRLDLYTVNFIIEHELEMNNGYKMTNLHGGIE